jgi:hypothetical protein
MTEQTQAEQTQPTEAAVFPEQKIRQSYPEWSDQKQIQEAYSGMTPERQAEFAKAVEDAGPETLTTVVGGFLASDPGEAGDAQTDPSSSPEGPVTSPQTDGSSGGSSGPGTGGQPSDGDQELTEALDTIETAEAYADDHPDRIEDLLAAEQAAEKPRKTLVESLERAQRRRDKEQKQGE